MDIWRTNEIQVTLENGNWPWRILRVPGRLLLLPDKLNDLKQSKSQVRSRTVPGWIHVPGPWPVQGQPERDSRFQLIPKAIWRANKIQVILKNGNWPWRTLRVPGLGIVWRRRRRFGRFAAGRRAVRPQRRRPGGGAPLGGASGRSAHPRGHALRRRRLPGPGRCHSFQFHSHRFLFTGLSSIIPEKEIASGCKVLFRCHYWFPGTGATWAGVNFGNHFATRDWLKWSFFTRPTSFLGSRYIAPRAPPSGTRPSSSATTKRPA